MQTGLQILKSGKCFFVFQGFYSGVEETRVHMVVTITSNILNVYLNAGFIYQFDRSGGSGTAAATLQTYLMPQLYATMHARNDGNWYCKVFGTCN